MSAHEHWCLSRQHSNIQYLRTLVLYFVLFYMGIASSDGLTHVLLENIFRKKCETITVPVRSVAGVFFSSSSLPVVGRRSVRFVIADATKNEVEP